MLVPCTVNRQWAGLTRTLKQAFFPRYSFRRARHEHPYVHLPSAQRAGKSVGKRLDRELGIALRAGRLPTGHLRHSRHVLQLIHDRPEVAVHAQLEVADPSLPLRTALDLLLWHPLRRGYTIVELKTGYRNYVNKYAHFMLPPLGHWHDCPFNQHRLQLLCSTRMFEVSFPHATVIGRELWYVSEDEVRVVEVAPLPELEQVWTRLKDTRRPAPLFRRKHQLRRGVRSRLRRSRRLARNNAR